MVSQSLMPAGKSRGRVELGRAIGVWTVEEGRGAGDQRMYWVWQMDSAKVNATLPNTLSVRTSGGGEHECYLDRRRHIHLDPPRV